MAEQSKQSAPPPEQVDIAIVGGGIAGIYCLYKLICAQDEGHFDKKITIALFEASDRLGGRIYTQTIPTRSPESNSHPEKLDPYLEFYPEFGPMRLETEFQPLLRKLLTCDLFLTEEEDCGRPYLKSFSDYRSPVDEHEPRYDLKAEESEQETPLDLLKLAFIRILGRLSANCYQDTEKKKALQTLLDRGIAEMSKQNSSRQADWKGTLQNWIDDLDEPHYQLIREFALFDDIPLHLLGFSNLLSEVLSYDAEVKLRDLGTFYHFLPVNPNAAEWFIFWLRALKTTTLQGIHGGMEMIINFLVAKLAHHRQDPPVFLRMKLMCMQENDADQYPLRLDFLDYGHNESINSIKAARVILALPKGPIDQIMTRSEQFYRTEIDTTKIANQHHYSQSIRWHLDRVFPVPLLKVFAIVKNRWWEEDIANYHATRIPTRELHYFLPSHPYQSRRGMIMIYTDNPNLTFWSNYIKQQGEQHRPEWNEHPLKDTAPNRGGIFWDEKPEWSGNKIYWIKYHGGLRRAQLRTKREERRLALKVLQYLRQFRPGLKEEDIEYCGIRDWGRPPYFGACHAWRPESKSWKTLQSLTSFHLNPAAGWPSGGDGSSLSCDGGIVHICGEAYSDYHGFIEGSLRSAAHVLHIIAQTVGEESYFESPAPWLCNCNICTEKYNKAVQNINQNT